MVLNTILFYFYLRESYFTFVMFWVSFFCTLFVLILKLHSLIFIEIWMFLNTFNQTFLLSSSLDLLNLVFLLVLSNNFFYNFFYFLFLIWKLNTSAWFKVQDLLFYKFYFFIVFYFAFFIIFLSYVGLPLLLEFLLNWEFILKTKLLFAIKVEFQFFSFISWLLLMKFQFLFYSFIFAFLFFILHFLSFFYKFLFFNYRAYSYLIVGFFLLSFFNFNFTIQSLFLLSFFICFEFVFLWICLKTTFFNAYN
uniref:Sec-independent protein translocase component TatC n=1 Tax=Centroceras gasparrinii TaxID=371099 RepID=UPI002E7884F8|nr:Sec-independent protein translocase component TatC [Centroceras gasparrinii]WQF69502.1 Sec-independent protein translocase component TatC [Centroceras gasparrinii]